MPIKTTSVHPLTQAGRKARPHHHVRADMKRQSFATEHGGNSSRVSPAFIAMKSMDPSSGKIALPRMTTEGLIIPKMNETSRIPIIRSHKSMDALQNSNASTNVCQIPFSPSGRVELVRCRAMTLHGLDLTKQQRASLKKQKHLERLRTLLFGKMRRKKSQPTDASSFTELRSCLTANALKMATVQLKMPGKDIWKALIAELVGTALLMILGVASGLSLTDEKALNLTGIGLCWGLTVATVAQTLGHVSGCHINPAVTLAMLVRGKLQLINAVLYILVQCAGAIMGTALIKALTPDTIRGNWAVTTLGEGITPLQGFGIEFVATFILLMVIFGISDENRSDVKGSGPLAVGLCVYALVVSCGPFTGASLNPARSLGSSVVAGHFDNHWVYWIGPISGAITAATLYGQVFRALSPDEVASVQSEEETRKMRDGEGGKDGHVPSV